MSRRTAEASKAVALAWASEQQRVREGNGTRDWTPEQQKEILERGKAYDNHGRAYEGQHMKSVEKYPEYQGDPDNIQFLTKEEHLEAHKGSWQNPTNWYYDPATREYTEFGEGKYIPCTVISLTEPIEKGTIHYYEQDFDKKNIEINNKRQSSLYEEVRSEEITKKTGTLIQHKKSVFDIVSDSVETIKEKALNFVTEHPIITAVSILVGGVIGKEMLDQVTGGGGTGCSSSSKSRGDLFGDIDDNPADDLSDVSESEGVVDDEPSEKSDSDEKAPQTKRPHDTRGYTRKRRGREENVRGYSTGKNREKHE